MNTHNTTNRILSFFFFLRNTACIWDSFTHFVKPFTAVTTFNRLSLINIIFRLFPGHATTAKKALIATVLATPVLVAVYNIGKWAIFSQLNYVTSATLIFLDMKKNKNIFTAVNRHQKPEEYSELCQTSKMECFTKKVNGF